jgi:hypothetical protein
MNPIPEINCMGVTSKCADGKHIIMVDFDSKGGLTLKYHDVLNALNHIIEIGKYSDFHIIQGHKEGHYHAYCPTKVNISEYLAVLETLEYHGADPNQKIPLTNWEDKRIILRFEGKGDLHWAGTAPSPYNNLREMSKAHLLFLNRVFTIPIRFYINTDGSEQIWFDQYKTHKP